MCVVSMITDGWSETVPNNYPWTVPPQTTKRDPIIIPDTATRQEVEALRREVRELRELLIKAKAFDESTGQPDCDSDEKTALFTMLAKELGVDMSDVFPEARA